MHEIFVSKLQKELQNSIYGSITITITKWDELFISIDSFYGTWNFKIRGITKMLKDGLTVAHVKYEVISELKKFVLKTALK